MRPFLMADASTENDQPTVRIQNNLEAQQAVNQQKKGREDEDEVEHAGQENRENQHRNEAGAGGGTGYGAGARAGNGGSAGGNAGDGAGAGARAGADRWDSDSEDEERDNLDSDSASGENSDGETVSEWDSGDEVNPVLLEMELFEEEVERERREVGQLEDDQFWNEEQNQLGDDQFRHVEMDDMEDDHFQNIDVDEFWQIEMEELEADIFLQMDVAQFLGNYRNAWIEFINYPINRGQPILLLFLLFCAAMLRDEGFGSQDSLEDFENSDDDD